MSAARPCEALDLAARHLLIRGGLAVVAVRGEQAIIRGPAVGRRRFHFTVDAAGRWRKLDRLDAETVYWSADRRAGYGTAFLFGEQKEAEHGGT